MPLIRSLIPASILAFVLGVVPGLPVVHAGDEGAAARTAVALSRIAIGNFGQVNDTYYRGEQPQAGDYADLAGLGIRTVIDLQADGDNADEPDLVRGQGMRFHQIPMTTRVPPTAEQLRQFLSIVTDPAQQPVYVHCAGGKHRTGVMTAVYRMERDQWTADQAYDEMKRYKFGMSFLHPEFKTFVYEYRSFRLANLDTLAGLLKS